MKKNKKLLIKASILNYFKPNVFIKSFKDLNLYSLKLNNIKLFICDLDNTLVPHFSSFPSTDVVNFINKIRKMGILFFIVSNNSKKRVKKFCDKVKIDGYIANAKKPLVKKIKLLLKKLNISAENTIMMGDQFIIDIFSANRLGCKSILVMPILDLNHNNTNKLMNFIENKIYKKLQWNNMIVDQSIIDNDIIFL